jgi:hypothetical protein
MKEWVLLIVSGGCLAPAFAVRATERRARLETVLLAGDDICAREQWVQLGRATSRADTFWLDGACDGASAAVESSTRDDAEDAEIP